MADNRMVVGKWFFWNHIGTIEHIDFISTYNLSLLIWEICGEKYFSMWPMCHVVQAF
jgi:hypothetical protein